MRRRRIAGESKPAAPVRKAPAKKATTKGVAAKKTAAKAVPVKKAPTKKTPTKKTPVKAAAATTVATGAATPSPQVSAPAVPKPVRRTKPVPPPGARAETVSASSVRLARRDAAWLVPAVLITVAVLVAGVFLTIKGIADRPEGSDEIASTQRQAVSVAGGAAETIFSYTYDKLDEHLLDSKALMTTKFAADFDKIAPALDEIAPQRKVQVKAVTRNAAALGCGDECSASKVNVLVFFDQARLIDGSKAPDVIANRVTISMVKVKDAWRVADIRAL